jgi:type I restriction enzyme M protein
MARRPTPAFDEWNRVARRLDETIAAHSGEPVFDEALKLIVAKLCVEHGRAPVRPDVGFHPDDAPTLNALLCAATERWPKVVTDCATRLEAPAIQRAAAILQGCWLGDDHLSGLNAMFQAMMSRSSRGDKGQFFTPAAVVREIVARVQPRAGERVADPACGSGGFLLEALRTAPDCSVWGFDQDPRVVQVARVLLCVAQASHARGGVYAIDSLHMGGIERVVDLANAPSENASFGSFDVILTNPPFAGKVGPELGQNYALGAGRDVERDVLFLERCLGLLRPGGRFAIVVPDNKVAGGRLAFVRRWLLCHARLTEVIALDRSTFFPHTAQKTCVLIGSRREVSSPAPVWGESIAFTQISGASCTRTVGQLDAGWVLAPERYAVAQPNGRTLAELVDVVTLAHRPGVLPQEKPALVLDTTHAFEGFVVASHAPVAVATIASPKRVLQPGDVIVSRLRSYLRQIAVVDDALFECVDGGNAVFSLFCGRGLAVSRRRR